MSLIRLRDGFRSLLVIYTRVFWVSIINIFAYLTVAVQFWERGKCIHGTDIRLFNWIMGAYMTRAPLHIFQRIIHLGERAPLRRTGWPLLTRGPQSLRVVVTGLKEEGESRMQ